MYSHEMNIWISDEFSSCENNWRSKCNLDTINFIINKYHGNIQ